MTQLKAILFPNDLGSNFAGGYSLLVKDSISGGGVFSLTRERV